MTNKKDLSERDICTSFIVPALQQAGWDMRKQVREEVSFTDGRIYVKGNLSVRGKRKRADYILYYKPNIPVAIIEAKDNTHSVMAGIQQALDYATILDIPSVFSSNGDAFYEHDRTATDGSIEREIPLHAFPGPDQLWEHYKRYKGIVTSEAERISAQDYFFDGISRSPRYYQQIAINRTVEAIAKGQQRILLTMATGTGKTYTAFQIIHRLWKAGAKKRILFLADRNALIEDYTRQKVREHYQSLDAFLNKWHSADKKQTIIDELTEQGIVLENLKEAIGKEMDIFDMICHTAFDQPPLTRAERARQVRKRDVFTRYGEQARKVLEALLDKYADEGIENIEDIKVLKVNPFDQFGTPTEIIKLFGDKQHYLQAVNHLEQALYQIA